MTWVINHIWLVLLLGGIVYAAGKGNVSQVTNAILDGSQSAIQMVIGLAGIMAFWSGLVRVADEAGMTKFLAKLLTPIVRRLFPRIPEGHSAIGAIVLSFAANLLGIGNAATPLGIKAMEELAKLNHKPGVASDEMCTFLALTTSSLTIVPSTVIALRQAAGSSHPTVIIGTTLLATCASTVTAIVFDRLFRGCSK